MYVCRLNSFPFLYYLFHRKYIAWQ
jgi:hypothetical protein